MGFLSLSLLYPFAFLFLYLFIFISSHRVDTMQMLLLLVFDLFTFCGSWGHLVMLKVPSICFLVYYPSFSV